MIGAKWSERTEGKREERRNLARPLTHNLIDVRVRSRGPFNGVHRDDAVIVSFPDRPNEKSDKNRA